VFFDKLTLAGIAAVSFYALLPVLFRKEIFRVDAEDEGNRASHTSAVPDKALRQQELSNSYSDC
jgi:hypothetical protein